MLQGKRILGLVPARSGSKGIPDKNMLCLQGVSLIGRAGLCLQRLSWLDIKVLSTDDEGYAQEGKQFGLDVPFVRPKALSTDEASAVDTIVHALSRCEDTYGGIFDVVVLVEPTSPFREPAEIERACRLLIDSDCDSVVAVSPLDTKAHPYKVLVIENERLDYFDDHGKNVIARQQLPAAYSRNGICYCLTRDCVLTKRAIITENTRPLVVARPVVNIDDPMDMEWAEFLLQRDLARFAY